MGGVRGGTGARIPVLFRRVGHEFPATWNRESTHANIDLDPMQRELAGNPARRCEVDLTVLPTSQCSKSAALQSSLGEGSTRFHGAL
ncbi:MAG: hypothetical protein ACR2QQ_03650, partial [Gammaproteobacteria bacterium]